MNELILLLTISTILLELLGAYLISYSKSRMSKVDTEVPFMKFLSQLKPLSIEDRLKVKRHDELYYPNNRKMNIIRKIGIMICIVAPILAIVVAILTYKSS